MPLTKNNNGFALLEVLISIFILAVGLLGLAGLQITGLKSNHSAQQRTEAIVLVYDIIDRMRINKVAAKSQNYDIDLGDPAPAVSGVIADIDRIAWLGSIANTLPGGDGAIDTASDVTTITIQWDDSRGTAGSATQSFTMSTQL